MSDNSHEEPGENGEKDRNDFVSQSMLAINAPPALDALVQAASPPIAHLNSFLAIHPHLLAKFSTEVRETLFFSLSLSLSLTLFIYFHLSFGLPRLVARARLAANASFGEFWSHQVESIVSSYCSFRRVSVKISNRIIRRKTRSTDSRASSSTLRTAKPERHESRKIVVR